MQAIRLRVAPLSDVWKHLLDYMYLPTPNYWVHLLALIEINNIWNYILLIQSSAKVKKDRHSYILAIIEGIIFLLGSRLWHALEPSSPLF